MPGACGLSTYLILALRVCPEIQLSNESASNDCRNAVTVRALIEESRLVYKVWLPRARDPDHEHDHARHMTLLTLDLSIRKKLVIPL